MALLNISGLAINFGGLKAVSDFNLELEPGELVGVIGPNGAGKTTVFNMITGAYRPTNGRLIYAAGDRTYELAGKKPHEITQLGIARTFQNIRLFKELSVIENVKIAYHFNAGYGLFSGFAHWPKYRAAEAEIQEKAIGLLKIFDLQDRADEKAVNLPYGEQRRLEIARALATKPRLLLLDEPAAGMNPGESRGLMDMIRWIRKEFDLTILLIEHHMDVVMGVCERITVLDYGVTIAHGKPDEIKSNHAVIEAYLGEEVEGE